MTLLHAIIRDLLDLLTLENGLLKDMKLKLALQHIDQKDQLMNRLSQEINLLKENTSMTLDHKSQLKAHLQPDIRTIQNLAKENDHLLQKINLVNQRILDRIMKKIRKLGSPLNGYTAQGKRAQQNFNRCSSMASLTYSNQV